MAENYTYADQTINFDATKRDRIVILEDADGDGPLRSPNRFLGSRRKLTSVEVGYGGVWVSLRAPPRSFLIATATTSPTGPPEVVLDGWDQNAVRLNIVNGLRWGPDGWLYGRHGILATSLVGKPGRCGAVDQAHQLRRLALSPDAMLFEVVAHGTTNPWGFDFDQHGEMFFINTVIGHLWHLVPGAHYERMGGADFNPHLYQLIGQTADHVHWETGEKWSDIRLTVSDTTSAAGGGHAHSGLMIYQGGNWPDRYRNSMFTLNFHGRRLNNDTIGTPRRRLRRTPQRRFVLRERRMVPRHRLAVEADGAAYIADWSDTGECHEADGVHHASGRIYRLAWGEAKLAGTFLICMSEATAQLVALQQAKNDWYVRQSRRLLARDYAAGNEMTAARQGRCWRCSTRNVTKRQQLPRDVGVGGYRV